ncbi:hypothetical protein [Chloroflexus aggregans]|uniref:hypothetical protein n=1 Tax=Chloroflexus aggregans TaxID=152260 RepID=UPI000320B2CB|nr:hypothetical protein [Chloroflexus aggregans]
MRQFDYRTPRHLATVAQHDYNNVARSITNLPARLLHFAQPLYDYNNITRSILKNANAMGSVPVCIASARWRPTIAANGILIDDSEWAGSV